MAARDRVLTVVGDITLVLTHAEFPRLYWVFLDWMTAPLLVVLVRNIMLAESFAMAGRRL